MNMRPSPTTAAVEEEVPKKALHTMNAEISHNTAMKIRPTPPTALLDEEVHKEAVRAAHAAISLSMAMEMLAVGTRQHSRSTSDMSWDGMTCRP